MCRRNLAYTSSAYTMYICAKGRELMREPSWIQTVSRAVWESYNPLENYYCFSYTLRSARLIFASIVIAHCIYVFRFRRAVALIRRRRRRECGRNVSPGIILRIITLVENSRITGKMIIILEFISISSRPGKLIAMHYLFIVRRARCAPLFSPPLFALSRYYFFQRSPRRIQRQILQGWNVSHSRWKVYIFPRLINFYFNPGST